MSSIDESNAYPIFTRDSYYLYTNGANSQVETRTPTKGTKNLCATITPPENILTNKLYHKK